MSRAKQNDHFLLYVTSKGKGNGKSEDEAAQVGGRSGRIANTLSKAIAYERVPELFDSSAIRERDNELRDLDKLVASDEKRLINRKGKPVVLTTYQARILYALSWFISRDPGQDVKDKIANPYQGGNKISRVVNITALSALLFGSVRETYKRALIRELFDLGGRYQVQIIGRSENHKRAIVAPFIEVDLGIIDLSPEKIDNADEVHITFGAAFFDGLDKRFTKVTPKLFEVWKKKGRGTELYSTLLSSIFAVYWSFRYAADRAERAIRYNKDNKKLPPEELEALVAEARRKALSYELSFPSIKKRLITDYDSTRQYKAKFKRDLTKAIEGYKELGLITKGIVSQGTNGQGKVTLVLNDKYNFSEEVEPTKLLEAAPQGDEETFSAF